MGQYLDADVSMWSKQDRSGYVAEVRCNVRGHQHTKTLEAATIGTLLTLVGQWLRGERE